MMRWAVSVVLLLMLAAPAWAGMGEGVAAFKRGDYATALREFRLAAEQGNAAAQYNLGQMYRKGQGVPQDYAEAVKWYRRAADQGDAYAQHDLGVMYDKGWGVPQDYAEAMRWYRKAATQGYASAQFNVGRMYYTGRGVLQDYVQAHKWYNLAVSSSPPGKGHDIATKYRDIVAKRMTPAQIGEAQRLARKWKPK